MRLIPGERSRRGGLPSPARRRLLAGVLAAPLLFVRRGVAGSSVTVLDRLKTGNHTLFPFTLSDGLLYLNGNAMVEAWDIGGRGRLWHRPLDAQAAFRPRLTENRVLSGGRTHLAGWERLSGAKRWSYAGKAELGVPLAHDGRVHFGEGHRLITLDAATGEPLWSFPTTANSRIGYAPTARGHILFLGPGDGILYAFSCSTGELLWKIDRESDWQYLRQLTVIGNILVAGGYRDEIFGLDMEDGSMLWRFDAGNFINSQLAADGAVCFWSPTGWVYALDAGSGSMLWRHRTVDYRDRDRKRNWAPVMAEMVADNGRLYVLAMDHVLHVLDLGSGNELEQHALPAPVRPFICLEPGKQRLLLGSTIGEVLYLELG